MHGSRSSLVVRLLLLLSALVASACAETPGDQGQLGMATSALSVAQCDYEPFWDGSGKIQICHYNPKLKKKKFEVRKVTPASCKTHVTEHVIGYPDFVAYGDKDCSGDGCLPQAAPCDPTVPCCEGLECVDASGQIAATGHCAEVPVIDACANNPCGLNEVCHDRSWPAGDNAHGRTCT
jgi:hypothetical protein